MQRSNKEIISLSLLALFWAIQGAVILQQLLGLWHAPVSINDTLLPEAGGRMAAKWDLVIYIFFITVALVAGKILFKYHQKSINYWLLIAEGAMAFLMVSALFKILVYFNSPQLAQRFLTALIIISVLGKIFYPELKKAVEALSRPLNVTVWPPYADAWWTFVIFLMIFMPDVQRVAAMIYMGESFRHFDAFIMGSGWASLCGQVLSLDVFSEYGFGLPVIFAKVTNALGGFDYVPALRVMMWFAIIYFVSVYYFARYWFRSPWVAGVVFLVVFRLQMFHYGVSPLIWTVPSASPLRFGLDVLWMAALLLHMRSGKSRWLILAALYSGFAFYYMTSTGLCVMATFYSYLAALIVLPSFRRQWAPDPRRQISYAISWVLPVIAAGVLLGMTTGTHLWQKDFWQNLVSYMAIFSHAGSAPMFESLKYRYFLFFFMSMVLPFTYLATLLYIAARLYLKKCPQEWLFTGLLCIYGLSNYQYYAVRSLYTSYYVNALPFVLISSFWFIHCLEFLTVTWQKRIKLAALVLSFYALFTNQNFLAYPNLINFSRNPMTDNLVIQRFPDRMGFFNVEFRGSHADNDRLPLNDLGQTQDDLRTEDDFKGDADLVEYYHSHFNFSEDAAMIKNLTKPQERVAVISSFEIEILIQANRAPFFYHFPLLSSRLMTFRTFPQDAQRLPSYLSDTLNELRERRPQFIFMEKVFLEDTIPASYKEKRDKVLAIIAYVRAHYQPWEQGKYLIAMKRVDK